MIWLWKVSLVKEKNRILRNYVKRLNFIYRCLKFIKAQNNVVTTEKKNTHREKTKWKFNWISMQFMLLLLLLLYFCFYLFFIPLSLCNCIHVFFTKHKRMSKTFTNTCKRISNMTLAFNTTNEGFKLLTFRRGNHSLFVSYVHLGNCFNCANLS